MKSLTLRGRWGNNTIHNLQAKVVHPHDIIWRCQDVEGSRKAGQAYVQDLLPTLMAKQWRQPYLVMGRHTSPWLLKGSRGKRGCQDIFPANLPLFILNCQLTLCQTLFFQTSHTFLFFALGFYINQSVQNIHFYDITWHVVLGHLSTLLGEQLFSEERVCCQTGRQIINSWSPGTVIQYLWSLL